MAGDPIARAAFVLTGSLLNLLIEEQVISRDRMLAFLDKTMNAQETGGDLAAKALLQQIREGVANPKPIVRS